MNRLLTSARSGTLEPEPVLEKPNPSFAGVIAEWPRRRARSLDLVARLVAVVTVALAVLVGPGRQALAQGDARTAQLTRLLNDTDFRVRTQAAFSLGRLDDPNAVTALLGVLDDGHPAVRAAAAVALGRLGDSRALPNLRRHQDDSTAVQSQVSRAISMIEASGGGRTQSLDWAGAHHYLELDAIANVSKTKRPGLDDLIRSISMREMRRLSGIVAVDSQSRPADVDTNITRRKLPGFAVSVSLGRLVRYMGQDKVRVQAEVMLAVVTYPDRNYRMTANGTGAVTIPRSSFREKQLVALQEDALSGALQQAFRTLGQTLEANAKTASASKSPGRGANGRKSSKSSGRR
jgi:hypothetical protein